MHKVAILANEYTSLFELSCAVELFALPRPEFAAWYHTDVVTFEEDWLHGTGDLLLKAKTINNLSGYDTVIVPCWNTIEPTVPQKITLAFQQFYQAGGRLLSFCSGAFLLAEIGLLDHKSATTHWRYAENFVKRYPSIQYVDNVLYLLDHKLGTSAGSAAAIDLGLAVIRHDFGNKVANKVARRMVLAAHREGGQSQYAEKPVASSTNHFSNALDWALNHLNERISVMELAKRANMSRRSFDRHFRNNFNVSAQQWLIQQRIERAKEYLEDSEKSIDQVAFAVGFETALTLRHHFRKLLGTSPGNYRKQFQ